MINLTYDLITAGMTYKEMRHAQLVMKELGITYERATPQTIVDCWQFWNCSNVPDVLPGYIRISNRNPMDFIGNGLDEETAKRLLES